MNKSHSPSPTSSPIPSSSHYSPHASPKKDAPVNRQRVDNGDKEDIENEPSLGYHSMNAGQSHPPPHSLCTANGVDGYICSVSF